MVATVTLVARSKKGVVKWSASKETGDGGTTLLHPTTDSVVVVVVVAVRLVTPWVDVDSRKSVDCGDGGHCYYCCHGHSKSMYWSLHRTHAEIPVDFQMIDRYYCYCYCYCYCYFVRQRMTYSSSSRCYFVD